MAAAAAAAAAAAGATGDATSASTDETRGQEEAEAKMPPKSLDERKRRASYHRARKRWVTSAMLGDSMTRAAVSVQRVYRGFSHRKRFREELLIRAVMKQSPLRTLCTYVVFLLVLSMLVVSEVGNIEYYLAHALEDWVVMEEFNDTSTQIYKSFGDIESEAEFWQYLEGPLAHNMFTEEAPHELFFGTGLAGPVRLRQLRVKPSATPCNSGEWPPVFVAQLGAEAGCYESLSDGGVETAASFNRSSLAATDSGQLERLAQCFRYQESGGADYSQSIPGSYDGWYESFPRAGGYICDLRTDMNITEVENLLNDLRANGWVDAATRGVILEMSIFSSNTNLFAWAILVIEFLPTGGLTSYATISTVSVLGSKDASVYTFNFIFRTLVYLFVCGFIFGEVREVRSRGCCSYIGDPWNFVDMFNYGCFVFSAGFWIAYKVNQADLAAKIDGLAYPAAAGEYLDVVGLGYYLSMVHWITSINCILSFMKVFAYMRASKKLSMLITTVMRSCRTFGYFIMVLIVFIWSYALAFYSAFHSQSFHFRSASIAFRSLIISLLSGETSDWANDIYLANRFLANILLMLFLFVVGTLVLAMFLAIIDDAFIEVSHEIDNNYKDPLVYAFRYNTTRIIRKWKTFVARKKSRRQQSTAQAAGGAAAGAGATSDTDGAIELSRSSGAGSGGSKDAVDAQDVIARASDLGDHEKTTRRRKSRSVSLSAVLQQHGLEDTRTHRPSFVGAGATSAALSAAGAAAGDSSSRVGSTSAAAARTPRSGIGGFGVKATSQKAQVMRQNMMYNLVHENHGRLAELETDLKNQVIATAKAQARMLEMQEQLAKAHADMSAHMELLHNEMVKWRADIHTSLEETSSSDS